MTPCPSRVALEQVLLTPEHAPAAAHVLGCAACTARMAELRAANAAFAQYVQPRSLERTVAAALQAQRPWWRRMPSWSWRWVGPLAATALALALVIVAGDYHRARPASDYVGTKGSALRLQVFADAPSGARLIGDQGQVPANAQVRFALSTAKACWVWLLSVDAHGQVSRIYPTTGSTGARVERAGALPGGGELDGEAGPERFVAVCSPAPSLDFDAVAHALEDAYPAGVSTARPLRGIPVGADIATVVVEKVHP